MGSALFHVGAQAMCPHGGQVSTTPGSAKVTVGGQGVASLADTFPIAGCSFTLPNGKPQPCMKVQWVTQAVRVKIGGQPAILSTSSGLCLTAEQIPQGPPSVVTTQQRATGT